MSEQFLDFFIPKLAELPLEKVVFSALDFETTGLYPGSDRIIEVGLVRFTLQEEIDSFESFLNPEIPIPEESTRICGISDEHVAGAPVFSEISEGLLKLLDGTVLLAHNLNFDYSFLQSELGRLRRKFDFEFALDSLSLARKVLPGRASYALQKLARELEFAIDKPHRALDDARLCRLLFLYCMERIPGLENMKLPELHKYSLTKWRPAAG